MTDHNRDLHDSYDQLLAERSSLTERIINLTSRPFPQQFAENIIALDEKRAALHRRIEHIGAQMGLNKTDVLGDIVLFELNTPRLEIPGVTGYPVIQMEGELVIEQYRGNAPYSSQEWEDAKKDGTRGVFFAFNTKTRYYDWRTELETTSHLAHQSQEWLSDHAAAFQREVQMRYPSDALQLSHLVLDDNGFAHVDETTLEGFFVASKYAREIASMMREGHGWPTKEELAEHRILETTIEGVSFSLSQKAYVHAFWQQVRAILQPGMDDKQKTVLREIIDHLTRAMMQQTDPSNEGENIAYFQMQEAGTQRSFALKYVPAGGEGIAIPLSLRERFLEHLHEANHELQEQERERHAEQRALEHQQLEKELSRPRKKDRR